MLGMFLDIKKAKRFEAQHSSMPREISCDSIQFNQYLLCILLPIQM